MKSSSRYALLSLPLLALAVGCEQPTAGKPTAEVSAPVKAEPAAAGGTAYRLAPETSKIQFTGAKVTGKHDGAFERFSGDVRVPGDDATKGSVRVEIDMDSVTSDVEKLTGHLKTADLFDVAKYPKARFVSTSIKAGGDKGASHTITGNLELHGQTKAVTFPATVRVSKERAEVDAEFTINRKDFGIVYPGMPDDLIKDDVGIKLTVRAPRDPQT